LGGPPALPGRPQQFDSPGTRVAAREHERMVPRRTACRLERPARCGE
jgi:hypothetical protein